MPSAAAGRVRDLDTPAVVIDEAAMNRNIVRMQSFCDRQGLDLWAHVKTHKMVGVARLQVEAGARGLVCQTVGEAEVMIGAGFERVLIPTPVIGDAKVSRLSALATRAQITVACDSSAGARSLSRALGDVAAEVDVLIERDVGLGRTGLRATRDAATLAAEIAGLPGLRVAGVLAHGTAPATIPELLETRAAVESVGAPAPRVSGGGTVHALQADGASLTEVRAGVYVFGDRATEAAGVTSAQDTALVVKATVVSRPSASRAILDAGSKTLTSDRPAVPGIDGYGALREYPGAVVEELSEEHAHVRLGPDRSSPGIGDVVTLVPNHACGVMNLHDSVLVAASDGTMRRQAVDARGRTS